MARQCQRPGCGAIVDDDRKRFHSKKCKNEDYNERRSHQRAQLQGKRCPKCGRKGEP